MGSEVPDRCPKCNSAKELGGGWRCGSYVGTHRTDLGDFTQGEHCRDRCRIAALTEEVARLKEDNARLHSALEMTLETYNKTVHAGLDTLLAAPQAEGGDGGK